MRALVMMLLFACGCNGASGTPDARPHNSCENTCPALCGNGRLDSCQRTMNSSCAPVPVMEKCDVGMPSCHSLGYFGGTPNCLNTCQTLDVKTCDVCAPGSTCVALGSLGRVLALVPSGVRVAMATDNGFAIYEGLDEITRVTLPFVADLAPNGDGWWLATRSMPSGPPALQKLSFDGVRGTLVVLPGTARPHVAAGPNGRVIAAWSEDVIGLTHAFSTIVDGDGNIVVPTIDHGVIDTMGDVSVTSDGTSFFVGVNGRLVRVTADGTATTTNGFPAATTKDTPIVDWGGTTGWYVQKTATGSYVAQRFDANGALVGGTIAVGPRVLTAFADTDGLRTASSATTMDITRFSLNQFTSAGAGGSKEVGVRESTSSLVATLVAGGQVLVAWNHGTKLELALVTP